VECKGTAAGQAVLLRFTALGLREGVDFVTLYAGAGVAAEDGAALARLTGGTVPTVGYGAAGGALLVRLEATNCTNQIDEQAGGQPVCDDVISSGQVTCKMLGPSGAYAGFCNLACGSCASSFAADYWCGPRAGLGCTDPVAESYDQAATVDDGSCVPACHNGPLPLAAGKMHALLNFTGGYADGLDCAWEVVCKRHDEAALLRFTSFDTTNYDHVTLYAGAGVADADQIAELSGAVVPTGAYGARNGALRVAFHSDGSVLYPDPRGCLIAQCFQFRCRNDMSSVQSTILSGCTGWSGPNGNVPLSV
jgi:hypothetical protein